MQLYYPFPVCLCSYYVARSALPILRQLGAQGGGTSLLKSVREGDTSMLKVWVGLEIRKYLQASAEQVDACVKYDQLSPNI